MTVDLLLAIDSFRFVLYMFVYSVVLCDIQSNNKRLISDYLRRFCTFRLWHIVSDLFA